MSHLMTKPTKWHVCPAKTQISLGIRPVWSESSLSAWRKLGSLATHWVHSEDSGQTGWMPFRWFCHEAAHIVLCLLWQKFYENYSDHLWHHPLIFQWKNIFLFSLKTAGFCPQWQRCQWVRVGLQGSSFVKSWGGPTNSEAVTIWHENLNKLSCKKIHLIQTIQPGETWVCVYPVMQDNKAW